MIDCHAHVAADEFNSDRAQLWERAKNSGLEGWIEIGTDLEQSRASLALAQQYDNVWATVGVHPNDISNLTEQSWQEIENLLNKEKVVGVGEVGFDFYRGGSLIEQERALRKFIELAQIKKLPIVFHVRDGHDINAHNETIRLLSSYSEDDRPRGVMHTYSGNKEQAKKYLELGMLLSFSGVVTFKNAQETAEIARTMPLKKMLIETDCPYLAPEPYRGKRNEPAYVALVAQKIADLRGVDVKEIDRITTENTKRLFGIKK